VLVGTDFFTVDLLTLKGLVTYYVLFFIHLETRRVRVAGLTPYPDQQWMEQQARNVTMKDWRVLAQSRYLLHDRDGKFCPAFREVIRAGKVRTLQLPARSPNECLCGALGTIGETGMCIPIDLLRGELAAPSLDAAHGALSRGAQSPG